MRIIEADDMSDARKISSDCIDQSTTNNIEVLIRHISKYVNTYIIDSTCLK